MTTNDELWEKINAKDGQINQLKFEIELLKKEREEYAQQRAKEWDKWKHINDWIMCKSDGSHRKFVGYGRNSIPTYKYKSFKELYKLFKDENI